MKQLKTKISENKKIAPNFYKMRVESLYLAKNTKPGQFFEVKCSDGIEPLLRRPLGVHRILKDGIELLYEIVGKGTELLSHKKPGKITDLIGPLGNGFFVQRPLQGGSASLRTTASPSGRLRFAPHYSVPFGETPLCSALQRSAILIAGGVGVVPLVALAEELRKKKIGITVIIGAKTKSHILCEDEFKSFGCEVKIATEDGSKGLKGLATELLRSTQYAVRSTLYACGPAGMLKAVAGIAEERRIPCQVSLEERMACGVGVCLGCPVRVKPFSVPDGTGRIPHAPSGTENTTMYGYKMVCKDGPVFDTKEIAW